MDPLLLISVGPGFPVIIISNISIEAHMLMFILKNLSTLPSNMIWYLLKQRLFLVEGGLLEEKHSFLTDKAILENMLYSIADLDLKKSSKCEMLAWLIKTQISAEQTYYFKMPVQNCSHITSK